jgi:phenylalanyl-tRNA synthetase alpha chain
VQQIDSLHKQFLQELLLATSTADIDALRVKYLGKKGPLQNLMKVLKDEVSPEERPLFGKKVNDLKEEITNSLTAKLETFTLTEENSQLANEKIDITLPGNRRFPGRKHLVTQTLDQILDILTSMGFTVQYGPEIDTDYYNFEALNFAPDHPARDMQDTFYLAPNVLLRTQTSNVQPRIMENNKPPLRIVSPGKCYRNETITARSHVQFHQIEAFYVAEKVTFADLFSTLQTFLERLFEPGISIRYRPSYFPFVEPGMEVDIRCIKCSGQGCQLCKHSGWLEILGAGMIHPEVLKNCDIDPEKFSGFAWGMGVERPALLKHSIGDIRLLMENDLRFLSQFH